jgi:hypothetical protein
MKKFYSLIIHIFIKTYKKKLQQKLCNNNYLIIKLFCHLRIRI